MPKKWEATRGVGHSFGANHNEAPEDVLSPDDLVRLLVDVVAKNGNLLIGVGPAPDGTLPDWQEAPLTGLGRWMDVHGEAIYGTRPWTRATATTSSGTEVRFTRAADALYAVLLGPASPGRQSLRGLVATDLRDVRLLGVARGSHLERPTTARCRCISPTEGRHGRRTSCDWRPLLNSTLSRRPDPMTRQ